MLVEFDVGEDVDMMRLSERKSLFDAFEDAVSEERIFH